MFPQKAACFCIKAMGCICPALSLIEAPKCRRMDDFGGFAGADGKSRRQLWMIYRGLNRMPSQRGVIDL